MLEVTRTSNDKNVKSGYLGSWFFSISPEQKGALCMRRTKNIVIFENIITGMQFDNK